MKEIIPFLIAMTISGLIFMSASIKYRWSERVWMIPNKKVKPHFSVAIWVLVAVLLQSGIQFLCETIGLPSPMIKIILGFTMGCFFTFMPNLGK